MESLEKWVLDACFKGGFSDRHIDYFDDRWKERSCWLDAGVEVLERTALICTHAGCSRELALVCSLAEGAIIEGRSFSSGTEFEQLLGPAPPSIFIAETGCEPWITSQVDPRVRIISLDHAVVRQLLPRMPKYKGLLMEYRPEGEEVPVGSIWFLPS